jgi:uncharacterized protein YbjT (DUF2867 family)
MKIIITGSLGHISKPLTKELVQKGHSVTVISSNPERKKDIETLGASAAIGALEDIAFLTSAFRRADVVYCMILPGNYLDPNFDIMAHYNKIGNNYAQAILHSGVKRVVHLSSIGGNMDKDNGLLVSHHHVENILKELPAGTAVTTIRATAFYYNLYAFLPSIKTEGIIASNYGEDDKGPWVSPVDIATAVAEEIAGRFDGRKIRYVASEELSCNEIATILDTAIGMPDLKWHIISDQQVLDGLKTAGLNPAIAEGLVEMNANVHNGKLLEDYYRNKPALGKIKMKDFAKEFAGVYNSK